LVAKELLAGQLDLVTGSYGGLMRSPPRPKPPTTKARWPRDTLRWESNVRGRSGALQSKANQLSVTHRQQRALTMRFLHGKPVRGAGPP
jgi:hypothetical protein